MMKLEDLEGWRLSIFLDGRNYCEGPRNRVIFEIEDRDMRIETDTRDGHQAGWIPLAAVVNVLRHLGWTVLPPEKGGRDGEIQ